MGAAGSGELGPETVKDGLELEGFRVSGFRI